MKDVEARWAIFPTVLLHWGAALPVMHLSFVVYVEQTMNADVSKLMVWQFLPSKGLARR